MQGSRWLSVAAGLAWTLGVGGCGSSSDVSVGDPSGNGSSSGSGAGSSSGSGNGSSGASGSSSGGSSTGGSSGSSGGASSSSSSGGSSSSGSSSGTAPVDGGAPPGTCGAGDPNMPPVPVIPPACTTLNATRNVAANGVPSESALDTTAIQNALNACGAGKALKLASSGSNNAFLTGPITIPSGVTLWVDANTTLYGTRDPNVYNNASALISVGGAKSGIVGEGVIDGQGGEPMIGSTQSWWDTNGTAANNPALISVQGATNFTLYQITLHNSPKFHVKLNAAGFVVWGVTIKTPSKPTNSAGTALTASSAHNTDGVDPGEAASNGFIVCSQISDGDDHIAIKGSSATGVHNLIIAHNHFEAGHGMSIGSEFTGGVSDVNVYDLSIDGTGTGVTGGSSNGIRIKSDSSRGGLVNNVTYSDVCTRQIANPILLTPHYSTLTGNDIPQYTNIKIQNFRSVKSTVTPIITLDGWNASVLNSVFLDNVVVDAVTAANVSASFTNVTLGPGAVNFTPSGTSVTVTNSVSGTSTPNACTNKWVTF
jgi:polygalacturonase